MQQDGIFFSQRWKEAERSLFCLELIASITENDEISDYVDSAYTMYHSRTAAKMLAEVNKGLELAKALPEYDRLKHLEDKDINIWGNNLHSYFIEL